MGKHYVPQRYLRGFECPDKPEWIWMYDKVKGACKLLPIKRVAQEDGFYSAEVEDQLTEYVEKPANAVIDKLRRGETPDATDRGKLAYYIGTMIRRVPRARSRAYENTPKVLTDIVRNVRERFEAAAAAGRLRPEALEAHLAEILAVERKLRASPPPEVVRLIETPWPFERMLTAIFSMTWRFLPSEGPSYFLTSDNPAYFFEAYGLGTERSELVFPLSKDLALHGSWQPGDGPAVLAPSQKLVKEFNRRIASGAERFVFYHLEQNWVLRAAANRVEQLNRILW